MASRKVTEPEIVDVLLGGADPALEARVRQAVRQDLTAATRYAEWAGALPPLQHELAPIRVLGEEARQAVMAQLAADKAVCREGRVPLPDDRLAELFNAELDRRTRRENAGRERWRLALRLGACAAALIALATGVTLFLASPGTVEVEHVSGKVMAQGLAAGAGQPVPLAAGARLKLPLRIQASADSHAVLRLPGQGLLTIADPVDLTMESGRRVHQSAGTARYRVRHTLLRDRFLVLIPQGTVEDLGTEFKVAVGEAGPAAVDVLEGRVRIMPVRGGAGVEVAAGQQALVSPAAAAVAQKPGWADLALERSRFQTRLRVKGPAPQAYLKEGPPAGVREVRYASGGLSLMAWLSAAPQDGKRHPAVVYLHRGFALAREDWDATLPYRQAGYVVLTPALRGENGNPGFFECYYGEVDDAIAAGHYLAARPEVDPGRVYLAGHGIGGGALAILGAMLPSPYAAAVAMGGAADPGRQDHDHWNDKVPFDAADPRERSLRTAADFPASIRCPLHLIVGEQDAALSAETRELAAQAGRIGKPCKVWSVPGDRNSSLERAIAQSIELFGAEARQKELADKDAPLHLRARPIRKTLAAGSPLAGLVHYQPIPLSTTPPDLVRMAPPFTSTQPLFGVLRTRLDGREIQVALACDKKVNGRWRFYLDANADGDLTNDPSFSEGEDFVADEAFEAGLLDRSKALWLRHPLALQRPGEEPQRLEFVNRRYDSAPLTIPGPECAATTHGLTLELNLLDAGDDGATSNSLGALAVWTIGGGEAARERIVALAPAGAPVAFAGRQWTLTRLPGGEIDLSGRKLSTLRKRVLGVGDLLPVLEAQTVEGRPIRLAPPKDGWLLLYVWSTWFSACQRDVPYSVEDLYPKFKDRGLSMAGIAVDYRRQDLLNYLAAHPAEYPQVFSGADLLTGVAAELGITESPTTILVNPQGRITAMGKSGEELWSLLEEILPARRPQ